LSLNIHQTVFQLYSVVKVVRNHTWYC